MIEQAMLVSLGACLAGLLALLFLPAISRRAIRLAREEVERQMPLSMDDVAAQRDLLRAEFAAERRRLEQAYEHLQEIHARDLSEAGRMTARLAAMTLDLERTTAERDAARAEAAQSLRQYNEAAGEHFALSKALYDAAVGEEDSRERAQAATAERNDAVRALDETRSRVAALEEALHAAERARETVERDLMQARLDLSVARMQAERVAAEGEMREDALRTALASAGDLRMQLAARAPAGNPEDLELLRRAIVEIGQEVVRLADTNSLSADLAEKDRPPASVH